MVGDALESCLRYIHNFDPTKSTNAFAYITQIIHNAFIRRIQKEQKQLYVKMRIVDQTDFLDSYEKQDGDTTTYNNSYVTYLQENKGDVISKFENWKEAKKAKAAKKKKEAKLDAAFEE
jgi:DNA-directed RNA polymerase specialized sigma24 family protein